MNGRATVRWLLTTRNGGVLIGSAVAAVISAGVTYGLTNKKIDKKYSDLADNEIEVALHYYKKKAEEAALEASGVYDDPEEEVSSEEPEVDEDQIDAMAESIRIMTKAGYIPYNNLDRLQDITPPEEEVVEVTASIQKSIWDEEQKSLGIDLEKVAQQKSQGLPHIVSEEDYYQNDLEWTTRQLTWFEGDDQLADEDERKIPEVDRTLGLENMRFGVGTKDSNVVYVANPQTQEIFEVTRSYGAYRIEVEGLDDEPDPRKTVYKMRPDM